VTSSNLTAEVTKQKRNLNARCDALSARTMAVERSLVKDARLTMFSHSLQATRLRLLGCHKCILHFSAHKGSMKASAQPTVLSLVAGSSPSLVAAALGLKLLRAKNWQ
jgi:hypothetical protein